VVDQSGRGQTLVYRRNDETSDQEHASKVIIVAAGGIESPRLLLLSTSKSHPDGLGNNGGHVGKHLLFHHLWEGGMRYKEALFPGRFGGLTGQSHQFLAPVKRGQHGGIKVEFTSHAVHSAEGLEPDALARFTTGTEVIEHVKARRHWRPIILHAESVPSSEKFLTLSNKRDRFGDPYAHVHYQSGEFDAATYRFGHGVFDRFAKATGALETYIQKEKAFASGAHHLGTCRMGYDLKDSVVDQYGRIHGTTNVFAVGGANFVSAGAVNPTLTMVALAIRSADYIVDQVL
jgi:choline dehydrogenase-like flavoprotein